MLIRLLPTHRTRRRLRQRTRSLLVRLINPFTIPFNTVFKRTDP